MPFSSQPRKKTGSQPQAESKTPACGHSTPQKSCVECKKKDDNVVDLPTEKKKLFDIREKIAEKLKKEPKAAEKAAFILSRWISSRRK